MRSSRNASQESVAVMTVDPGCEWFSKLCPILGLVGIVNYGGAGNAVPGEVLLHFHEPPVEAGFHGRRGQAQGLGDFREGEAFVLFQDVKLETLRMV